MKQFLVKREFGTTVDKALSIIVAMSERDIIQQVLLYAGEE